MHSRLVCLPESLVCVLRRITLFFFFPSDYDYVKEVCESKRCKKQTIRGETDILDDRVNDRHGTF